MLVLLILIVAILLLFYINYKPFPIQRTRRFQASCQKIRFDSLDSETQQELLKYSQDLFLEALKNYEKPVSYRTVTVRGFDNVTMTINSMGPESSILPCLDDCVCTSDMEKSDIDVVINNANLTVRGTDIPFTVSGFMHFNCSFEVDIEGVNARIETNGQDQLRLTSLDYKSYTIKYPPPDSPLIKLINRCTKLDYYIKDAINKFILNKAFYVPSASKILELYHELV